MLKGLQKHSPLLFSLQRPRRCQRGERRRGRRGALLTHQREKEAVPKGVLLARAEERGGERTERRRRRSLQVQSTGWQKPRSSAQHGGGGKERGKGERERGSFVTLPSEGDGNATTSSSSFAAAAGGNKNILCSMTCGGNLQEEQKYNFIP